MDKVFDLLPSQREFVCSTAKFRHAIGGISSGRTTAVVYLTALIAQSFSNNCILIGRFRWGDLMATTKISFIDMLDTLGFDYEFKVSEQTLTMGNGTKVLFRELGEDSIHGLMGLSLGAFVIEQLEEVPERNYWRLRSKLFRQDLILSRWGEENPEIVRLFYKNWQRISITTSYGVPPDWIRDLWKDPAESRYEAIYFDTRDNVPNLPKEYTRNDLLESKILKNYLEGSWDGGSNENSDLY